MRSILRGSAVALVALALAAKIGAAEKRRIEIADLHRIVRVADPRIAPNGKSIACVVSRANVTDSRWESEIVLVDVGSGALRPLTYGRRSVSSPRWSPSGDRLAFLAPAGEGKAEYRQVFVLPMSGGEAQPITGAPRNVQQFTWRPGGKDLAYVVADEPANQKEIDAHNDAFEVGSNDYLATSAAPVYHLWLVPAAGGAARRLTSGAWSLSGDSQAAELSWSPDGKRILFTRVPESSFGATDQSRVQVLDVETGQLSALGGGDAYSHQASFSPDGTRIAFAQPRDRDFNNENEVLVLPAGGGAAADVTRALDRDILHASWMPDGRSLLVGGHDRTTVGLWIQPLDGPARRIALADVVPSWSYNVDANVGADGAIAFTGSEPGRPAELYYLSSPSAPARRLTRLNDEVAALELGRREAIEWEGPDGFHEDGVLTFPSDFDAARKYPLVLYIHGGPQSSSTMAFAPLASLMAARGWVVFSPNYRGSDNLGNAYQRAIFNDAGAGPGRTMSGIEAVKKRGVADASRIGVSGWSLRRLHDVVVDGALSTSGGRRSRAPPSTISSRSTRFPISTSATATVSPISLHPTWTTRSARTGNSRPCRLPRRSRPRCSSGDTGDARVPITQSYQMFRALRDNGVTTKFFAIPVAGHFPADPVRAADVSRRWIDWLAEHLK